jgi:hypothetical protein
MRRSTIASGLFLTALFLSACQAAPAAGGDADAPAPAPAAPTLPDGERFGEAIEPRASVAFAAVDARPSDYFERTVLVEATVTAVCRAKGCWMQVEDEGRTAMVRWETGCGGRYAFPAEAVGRRVLVQGSFYPKRISEEDAAHLEDEAGEAIEIERDGYEFNASAVLLIADAG